MKRLDPLIERAVRAAFRRFDLWGGFDPVDDVDEFIAELARELETERANETR